MPLVIYKRSNRTHAVLPINLKITTSLIISLIYLQILYLVSFLAKPFWSSAGEFPPFKHNIERWERTIIDIIIAIVPFSNYRSPNPSAILHSDALLHRSHNTTYSTASHVNLDGIPLMPPKAASSAFVYPVTIPQCYPGTAIEGMTPVMAMTERSDLKLDLKGGGIGTATAPGSTITKPGPVMDRYGRNGDPVYETVKKPVPGSGSKSRSPGGSWHRTGINTSGTGSGSGTGTGTGIVTSAGVGNTPVLGSQHSPQHTPSRSRTQSQSHATKSTPSPPPHPANEYTLNLNMNPSQIIKEQDEDLDFKPLHQVHNLSALMRPSMASVSHLPNTPRPSQKSPVHSLDGPHDAVQSIFTARSTDDEDKSRVGSRSGSGSYEIDGVKLERATKCRSTESYPGKFPVSEGQDFSSLATAEYTFREKGTVTVRPFSDY